MPCVRVNESEATVIRQILEHCAPGQGIWTIAKESFPAKLTPDPLTGLRSGVRTEELFIKGMRTVKRRGDGARHPAADGVAGLCPDERRRPQGDLGVSGSIPAITNHVPDLIP